CAISTRRPWTRSPIYQAYLRRSLAKPSSGPRTHRGTIWKATLMLARKLCARSKPLARSSACRSCVLPNRRRRGCIRIASMAGPKISYRCLRSSPEVIRLVVLIYAERHSFCSFPSNTC
ncbi:MAG: hypothetical protein AVDCRST_MAG91-1543, partial [uncultured Sphingomonadaceae bacterium]